MYICWRTNPTATQSPASINASKREFYYGEHSVITRLQATTEVPASTDDFSCCTPVSLGDVSSRSTSHHGRRTTTRESSDVNWSEQVGRKERRKRKENTSEKKATVVCVCVRALSLELSVSIILKMQDPDVAWCSLPPPKIKSKLAGHMICGAIYQSKKSDDSQAYHCQLPSLWYFLLQRHGPAIQRILKLLDNENQKINENNMHSEYDHCEGLLMHFHHSGYHACASSYKLVPCITRLLVIDALSVLADPGISLPSTEPLLLVSYTRIAIGVLDSHLNPFQQHHHLLCLVYLSSLGSGDVA